jgi:mannose-6-phosphate isomerase-like protein (cupin superfamily)
MFIRYISKIHICGSGTLNVCHYQCLPEKETCCTKTKVRKLLQKADCATSEIELYEMQPNGYSPLHSHKARYTILVLEGEGIVFDGEKTLPLQVDDVVSIEANEKHQLKNVGKKPLKFLAITARAKD